MHSALLDAGWEYVGIRNGHHRYRAPVTHTGRAFLSLPSTPGEGRSEKNARANLRREGIAVV